MRVSLRILQSNFETVKFLDFVEFCPDVVKGKKKYLLDTRKTVFFL